MNKHVKSSVSFKKKFLLPNFHFFSPCWMAKKEEGSVGKPAFTQLHPAWRQEQGELSWVQCSVSQPPPKWGSPGLLSCSLEGTAARGWLLPHHPFFSSWFSLGCFSEKPCRYMADFIPHPGHQHPQFLLLPLVCRDWRTSLTSNLPTGQPWPWQRIRSLKFLWGMNFMGRSTLTAWTLLATVFSSVQFSLVTQSCQTVCDPTNHSVPGLPVHQQLLESTQSHVHCVSDAIQPSHPLSSPSPPALNLFQHKGLFKQVSSPHQVAKVLEFQLQHQSLQWTPRTDLL